ncbi:hypothetical protein, partial [Dactylosporangium sp. NPDC051484]|uniref:hypothetical protein n=1 Tax=Dactylosporangium sp. NPDC051484 TaxID=3154942 RepID=UPI00344F6D7E
MNAAIWSGGGQVAATAISLDGTAQHPVIVRYKTSARTRAGASLMRCRTPQGAYQNLSPNAVKTHVASIYRASWLYTPGATPYAPRSPSAPSPRGGVPPNPVSAGT